MSARPFSAGRAARDRGRDTLVRGQRIVRSTDGTEFGCEWTIKALAEAQIGEEAREEILQGNAAALLSRRATAGERVKTAA